MSFHIRQTTGCFGKCPHTILHIEHTKQEDITAHTVSMVVSRSPAELAHMELLYTWNVEYCLVCSLHMVLMGGTGGALAWHNTTPNTAAIPHNTQQLAHCTTANVTLKHPIYSIINPMGWVRYTADVYMYKSVSIEIVQHCTGVVDETDGDILTL